MSVHTANSRTSRSGHGKTSDAWGDCQEMPCIHPQAIRRSIKLHFALKNYLLLINSWFVGFRLRGPYRITLVSVLFPLKCQKKQTREGLTLQHVCLKRNTPGASEHCASRRIAKGKYIFHVTFRWFCGLKIGSELGESGMQGFEALFSLTMQQNLWLKLNNREYLIYKYI